jgi:hypothetical protein
MRLTKAALCVSVTVATLLLSGVPAMADEVAGSSTAAVEESVVTLPNTVLEAAADDPATATQRDAATDEFVAEQARSGKLVDAAETNASVVDGVATVWEDGVDLTSVKVTTAAETDSADVVAQNFEVIGSADPSAEDISDEGGATVDDEVAADDGVATGLGLSGLASPKGGKFLSGYCTTTSKYGDKLTSCYEKYKINTSTKTRDYYYYGRWATAVGDENCALCFDAIPTRIDIRSRPWSGSPGAGFAALVDYWPRAGVKSCNDHTIEISVKDFSGKIPIQDCDEINPVPVNTSMRVIYDQGKVFSGRTRGVDMGFAYSTSKGKNPQLADYSYAKFCTGTYANCDGVARQDSGW